VWHQEWLWLHAQPCAIAFDGSLWPISLHGVRIYESQRIIYRTCSGVSSTLDKTHIYAQLAILFHDVFDDDSITLTPDLSAKDVDGWDSLSHIRLLLTIEKSFKIKFSTSEVGKLQNVGDLVTLIEARAENKTS
jgi:acyl carrier protein